MIASGDVVVATGAMANGVALKGREAVVCAGNVIVWLAFATVIFRTCITDPCELVAVNVTVYDPAVVGVPVSVAVPEPIVEANVTPGTEPDAVIVGVGPPLVVTLNVAIAVATVNVGTMLLDVNAGEAMLTGVTFTVADAALLPAALVATTEHTYSVPLVRPETVLGEPAPVLVNDIIIGSTHVAV